MAGLAGHGRGMLVQDRFRVHFTGVATGAADVVLTLRGDDHGIAGNVMVGRFMATGTGQIGSVGTHVDVDGDTRRGNAGIEVAMLDRVAAAPEEMAASAGFTRGLADILGHQRQVDLLGGKSGSGRRLFVGAGGVVADQAIHLRGVGQIETGILPAVADVATGAARFVRPDGNAEVVDGIDLPAVDAFSVNDLGGRPGPVAGLHDVGRRLLMALQANFRRFGAAGDRTGDERMVCRLRCPAEGQHQCPHETAENIPHDVWTPFGNGCSV